MRVVMLLTNPFKPDPRVYKEAKSLAKHGYDVYIIAWDREGKHPKFEEKEGFKVIRVGPRAPYGMRMVSKLPIFYLHALKEILKLKPAVLHTHDFDTALLGFLFKLFKGVSWVYDIHDLYFTFPFLSAERGTLFVRLVKWIIKQIDLFLAKCADFVIVPTQSIGGRYEGLREYYVKNGVVKKKIITIWNVPDLSTFLNFPRLKLRKSKKFTIGFIGSQRTVSNFLALFEAIRDEASSYKILFVGMGKRTHFLKKIVKERYPELDVEFIDHVDYRVIPNYYHLCDVVYSCYPMTENVKRGVSSKIFEAAVLGIPVIVNEGSLSSDFIRRYKCGVCVDIDSVFDLKEKIMLARNLRFNLRVIREKWNWKNMESRLIQMYTKFRVKSRMVMRREK